MTVAYLIEFNVKPEREARFLKLLSEVLRAMSAEPNFRGCAFNADPQTPGRFLLYEAWADHEDVLQVQLLKDYRRTYHEELDDLLAAPREISIWSPVTAYSAPV